MISYDEAFDALRKYRTIMDKETGQRRLVEQADSSKVIPKNEALRIEAARYLYQCVDTMTKKYNSYFEKQRTPWTSEAEKVEWMKRKMEELQLSLEQIALDGEYECVRVGTLVDTKDDPVEQLFIDFSRGENGTDFSFGARSLLEYTLIQKGKKLEDITHEKKGRGMIDYFSWTTKDRSFKERLSPNAPAYTQADKPKSISPEGQAKRKQFAEDLIEAYLMAETDDMYNKRTAGEDKAMKYAADTVNGSKTIQEVKKDLPHLMRLLIAAQNISLDGERDYLEEILAQPAISQALLDIRKDGQLEKITAIGEKKAREGKVVDGRTHRETKGQLQRRIANGIIRDTPDAVSRATQILSKSSKGTVKSERRAMLFCVVARTQGKIPSYEENGNGTYTIDTGEEITR